MLPAPTIIVMSGQSLIFRQPIEFSLIALILLFQPHVPMQRTKGSSGSESRLPPTITYWALRFARYSAVRPRQERCHAFGCSSADTSYTEWS